MYVCMCACGVSEGYIKYFYKSIIRESTVFFFLNEQNLVRCFTNEYICTNKQ